jgi:hypothetical protein
MTPGGWAAFVAKVRNNFDRSQYFHWVLPSVACCRLMEGHVLTKPDVAVDIG